jgi:tetratricopeptide (TPR) repeat protein
MSNSFVASTQNFVRSVPLKSKLALLLVLSSALGALGWLWWSAVQRSKISFLPTLPGAEWIIYPKAVEGRIHPHIEVGTSFSRSFVLDAIPEESTLKISGFHHYSISLNGHPLNQSQQRGRSWKDPDQFSPSKLLRRGTNEILVTVANTNGPPALWLLLKAGNFSLKSDESWEATHAGAVWKNAQLAKKPLPIPVGNDLYVAEGPGAAFARRWPILLLFAVISAVVTLLIAGIRRTTGAGPRFRVKEWVPIAIFAALWIGIFVNNLPVLPAMLGYDTGGHRDYISYIETKGSLPLAGDGWEMFQPPLYYIICTALLKLLSLTVRAAAGVAALRVFGLVTGITHFVIVWKSLRLLFPENRARHFWGLLLAATLPPALFLSHYVSNEALAAVLVSGSVYLCLRILKQESPSWKIFAGFGLCLGAALLTKSTAVLALPPIFGALLWKAFQRRATAIDGSGATKIGIRASDLRQFFLVAGMCLLVSAWHYLRTWHHYGSPFVGVWDTRSGFFWWQDDGYRTAAFYLRFGQVFFRPFFSALHSFADGIYSTLWGDGGMAGADSLTAPPWNYDFMALAYWLALVPTLGVLIGAFFAIRRFVRQPSPEWFLILGLGFLVAFAVTYMSLTIPYYCVIKAFYGFSALIPFCAFGAWGLEQLTRLPIRAANHDHHPIGLSLQRLSAALCTFLIGVWALASFASFWIVHSSDSTLVATVAALMAENRPLEAQRLLEQKLASAPQNRRARAELAKILIVNKNEQQAAIEAGIVAKAEPADASNIVTSTKALQDTNPDLAIEQARRAIKIAPGYAVAYEQLLTLLRLQKRYAEVEQAAREGLALEAFNPLFYQMLGEALVRQGQIADGISLLKASCHLHPENVSARCLLAEAYDLHHETPNAIKEFAEALRLEPNNPSVLNNLAWLRATNPHEQFRDGPEAVRLAERACQLTEYKEPKFVTTLAAALAAAGRFDEALQAAAKARDLAQSVGQKDLVKRNEELINLFTARQQYRQTQK